jgi:hypothetical protein
LVSHPEFGSALRKMGRMMQAAGAMFNEDNVSFIIRIMASDC